MRVRVWSTCSILAVGATSLIISGFVGGASGLQSQGQKTPRFVGVDHCAKCHANEGTNFQFQVWEKGPHARAYKTLGSKEAAKIAKEAGVEVHPQQAPECLKCHSTGHGQPSWRYAKSFDVERGVSCESCHGAGEHYAKIEHMITRREAVDLGLIEPAKSVCLKCHNKDSPTYRGFDYVEAVAIIKHPLPSY